MSLYTSINGKCEAILIGLESVLGNNDPQFKVTPVGFLESLFDPTNRRLSTVTQNGVGTGHYKSVRIKWKDRTYGGDGRTEEAKTCGENAEERDYNEEPFNINSYIERAVKIPESRIKLLCEAASALQALPLNQRAGTPQYAVMQEVMMDILGELNGLRADLNIKLHEQLVLNLGAYVDGDTSKNFEFLDATGNPQWKGINDLTYEYVNAEETGTPIVVGFGNTWRLTNSLQFGCCNLEGIDFGMMRGAGAPYKYYQDKDIATTLTGGTGNEALLFAPGLIQLGTFNEYTGSFASQIDNVHRGTFVDPMLPGLRYDLRIVENGCDENYIAILGLWYDLFFSPYIAGLGDGDVNGIFKYVATATAP